jgi:hypothetical protein
MAERQASGRILPRPFSMHWGEGQVVEEVSAETPYHEATIQLLEFDDGSLTLRFCYYHGTRFGRGALMVQEEYLDQFAEGLEEAPRTKALLERMLGKG